MHRGSLADVDFVRPVEAVIPGTQGRVLAVLAETTAELNLRTVARLSNVSPAQASRVLPGLVELGLVERREVPPASLFRLNPQHVIAKALQELSRSRENALDLIRDATDEMQPHPVSVVVFGSFARGEADHYSDIDALIVRPAGVAEDDEGWASCMEQWRTHVFAITGNPVEVLEADQAEAAAKLGGEQQVWQDIARDGIVIRGVTLEELRGESHG